MVDQDTVSSVRNYLRYLAGQGIKAPFAVVFGSRAAGRASEWSDIDLVVVSAVFDRAFPREMIDGLWRAAARTDSRIEPIPCGERQWRQDASTPILEAARQEGFLVYAEG